MRTALVAAALAVGLLAAALPAGADGNPNTSAKLREAVTLQGVRRHQQAWQQIADANGGNRFAGLPGHGKSAEYVIEQLEAAGYQPVVHEFDYEAFFERTTSQLAQVSPNAVTYVNGNDFRIMSYSGSGSVTAPVFHLGAGVLGCNPADFAALPAGSIALVSRGACTFRIKTDNAAAAGASAILIYNNTVGVINGTLGATGLSAIPSLGITQSLGQSLASQLTSGPVIMRVLTDTAEETLPTYNVLAEKTGIQNPQNVVMAGAHLDSVTAGPGINDNGSGSAAILETAIQMAKVKPFNTIRFAWWSAEESGLIGAREYVTSLTQAERDKIALYLNFDMVGSPNFVRFVYDGDNSAELPSGVAGPAGSETIEQLFVDYFASQGLESAPTPFNGRSDYGPFIDVGIPAGGLFTGAEGIKTAAQADIYGGLAGVAFDPCYHAACDDYENNSDLGLDQMSDAIAHSIITYAQSTTAINQVRGK
ncbi:MAG TPA: M28 family metallopeptidase, partial [Actinomycetota bacterium]|nr:M28 family metallopeptidase [Actinomycetota bacterium]